MKLKDEIKALEKNIIGDRRYLHQNPELGFQEKETTDFLMHRLKEFGIEIEELDIPTGISAIIRGKYPGPTVCIRHDIDALPIQENTNLDYSSQKPEISHSCGHDIHAVIALYCAKLLKEYQDELHGNVRVVFQPAEETGRGAKFMAKAGVFDLQPLTDVVVGLHTYPEVSVGDICLRKGAMEAGAEFFKITIKGCSGHGAHPHECVDPIVVSAYLITQLQTIISRENQPTKPSVLSIGSIHGGKVYNEIPGEVVLLGTLRYLYPETRKENLDSIRRITHLVCESMRAEGIVEVLDANVPQIINDDKVVDGIICAANKILGEGHVKDFPFPSMGSDDFSGFLVKAKGAQFFLGTGTNDEQTRIGLHNGENIFDEGCLTVGVSVLTQYVLDTLKGEKE